MSDSRIDAFNSPTPSQEQAKLAEQEKIRRDQEKEAEMMARLEKIPPTQIRSPPPIDVDARMAQMQAKTPSQVSQLRLETCQRLLVECSVGCCICDS